MAPRRQVIRAGWAVPVDADFRVIRRGAVAIEGDRILAVGPAAEVELPGAEVMEFPRHALLPGLINVHTHVAGCVFRGLLEDREDGFYGLALPMERFLDPDAIYALSLLGIAEVLLAGCTQIHEIYLHAAQTARAAVELGVRAQIAHKVLDTDLASIREGRHDKLPELGDRRLEENVRLYEEWHGTGDGRVEIRFGAHAADTCSRELLRRVREEAERRGAGRHIHVAQNPVERDYMQETYGIGSIEFLYREGFLSPQTVVAHLIYARPEEIPRLVETDTPMAHCPVIAAKNAGFAPVRALYEAGIRLGWGTDWATMDPWDAMRFGISVSRVVNHDIAMLSAREALWRSTMGSAQVLGCAEHAGSLEPGKRADLILVDLDQPHLAPLYDPVTTLVYNASGRDVTHVMVGGRFVVDQRRVTTADTARLVAAAQEVAERVWRAGGLAPVGVSRPKSERPAGDGRHPHSPQRSARLQNRADS